jgi:hypothetical protein
MAVIRSTMITKVVIAPDLLVRSEAVRRWSGSLSVVRLAKIPIQKGPRYQMVASMGALAKAGRVKRQASRQKA